MNKIQKYILDELECSLDKEEQVELLAEYERTRDPALRQFLLEHNERLCLSMANKICTKFNCMDKVQDLFCEFSIVLAKALEKYRSDGGAKFSTYVSKSMYRHVEKLYNHEQVGVLGRAVNTVVVDCDDDLIQSKHEDYASGGLTTADDVVYAHEPEEDYLDSLDEICENYASNEFIKDIISFIESWEDKDLKYLLKRIGGIGCEKATYGELAHEFNLSDTVIKYRIEKARRKVGGYIAENYPLSYPKFAKYSDAHALKFEKPLKRDEYIYISYTLGKKTVKELCDELNMTSNKILLIIAKVKDRIRELSESGVDGNREKEIFNAYFGINGFDIHTEDEIKEEFNLDVQSCSISHLVHFMAINYINDGTYTREKITSMEKYRDAELEKRKEKYAYEYNAFYGINGCQKRTLVLLSEELGISRNSIAKHIRIYEEYLKNKSQNEEHSSSEGNGIK